MTSHVAPHLTPSGVTYFLNGPYCTECTNIAQIMDRHKERRTERSNVIFADSVVYSQLTI